MVNKYLGYVKNFKGLRKDGQGKLALFVVFASYNADYSKYEKLQNVIEAFCPAGVALETVESEVFELSLKKNNSTSLLPGQSQYVAENYFKKSLYQLIYSRDVITDYIDPDKDYIPSSNRSNFARDTNIPQLLLQDKQDVTVFYGPLKKTGEKINALKFNHVNKYKLNLKQDDVYRVGGRDYLLWSAIPDECIQNQIDCSSREQLVNWFKDQLNTSNDFSLDDVPRIRNMLDTLKKGADELRSTRVRRLLDLLKTKNQEVSSFLMTLDSPRFSELIKKQVESYKQDIYKEVRQTYTDQVIKELESQKQSLDTEITQRRSCVKMLQEEINAKQKLVDGLASNYNAAVERLKLDLPVIRDIIGKEEKQSISITPIAEFSKEGKTSYSGVKVLENVIENNLRTDNLNVWNRSTKAISNMMTRAKACFIPSTSYAIAFAKATQNAKVWLFHVEYDWLHYSNFCDQGLLDVWNYANSHPDENCILVFDSLNLTQPECGFKPVLDVINGSCPILQGTRYGLARNMRIFATIQPSTTPDNPGMPLVKGSYMKWDAIGGPGSPLSISTEDLMNSATTLEYLSPEYLWQMLGKDNQNAESRKMGYYAF